MPAFFKHNNSSVATLWIRERKIFSKNELRTCVHTRAMSYVCVRWGNWVCDLRACGQKTGRNSPLEISMMVCAGKSSLISGLDVDCILKECIFSKINKISTIGAIFDCELLL